MMAELRGSQPRSALGFPCEKWMECESATEEKRMKNRVGWTLEREGIPHQLLFITQRQHISGQPLINCLSLITSSVKSVHNQAAGSYYQQPYHLQGKVSRLWDTQDNFLSPLLGLPAVQFVLLRVAQQSKQAVKRIATLPESFYLFAKNKMCER